MCYTTDEYAKPKTEVKYNASFPYGTDGYRTNCNNIEVGWCILFTKCNKTFLIVKISFQIESIFMGWIGLVSYISYHAA